jgi:hypothetical protein
MDFISTTHIPLIKSLGEATPTLLLANSDLGDEEVDIANRAENYKAVESFRNRPLIVYSTSTRLGVGGQMAGDAVREFIDQINQIPEGDSVDVLIHSTGGDALTAWKLMTVLRERFDDVSVLVPYMAFSAATMFCLGADEIVMHPHASLGPIDPQIQAAGPDGNTKSFSYEDVGAFLRFLDEEVKITDQSCISTIVDRLFAEVYPLVVGGAKRASELATDVGERLLKMHITEDEGAIQARQIAENLNKAFFAHGDAVSRSRARSLNLNIAEDNEQLEELIWKCYLGIESYMEFRTSFDPVQHLLKDATAAAALAPPAPLHIPPGLPPQTVQQVIQQAANTALNNLTGNAAEVDYSFVNALIESSRVASEYRTKGKLSGHRMGDGRIGFSAVDTESGWKVVQIPTT